jgi:hypothetical protein
MKSKKLSQLVDAKKTYRKSTYLLDGFRSGFLIL